MKNLFYSLFLILSCNVYSQFNNNDFFTYVDIPDTNFKNALLDRTNQPKIDTNSDGKISIYEAKEVTKILVGRKNISSIKGIEFFENLEHLSIWGNNIQRVDLKKNINLKKLYCNQNQLLFLDLSKNTKLELLSAVDNQLISLKVDSVFLTSINITRNDIANLDLSGCPNLNQFEAQLNRLESLDLSSNTNLEYLYVPVNRLTGTLDVSFCKLKHFNIGYNPLTSIKMINQPLTYFFIANIPSLESICVDNNLIPFVTDELNRVGLSDVEVTNSCNTVSETNGEFSEYFTLSPNPTYGRMLLNKKHTTDRILISSSANILNMNGVVVKRIPLLFEESGHLPLTIDKIGNKSVLILVDNLPEGNYILSIVTSEGNLTTQFRRIAGR